MKVESCEQALFACIYQSPNAPSAKSNTKETILSCGDFSCFLFIVVMMFIAFTMGDSIFSVFCAAFADAVCKLSYHVTVG